MATCGFRTSSLTGITLWQALRGQPLIQPDGLTLLAAGVLVALVVVGAATGIRRAGRTGVLL